MNWEHFSTDKDKQDRKIDEDLSDEQGQRKEVVRWLALPAVLQNKPGQITDRRKYYKEVDVACEQGTEWDMRQFRKIMKAVIISQLRWQPQF